MRRFAHWLWLADIAAAFAAPIAQRAPAARASAASGLTVIPPCPHEGRIRQLDAGLPPRVRAVRIAVRELEGAAWRAVRTRPQDTGVTEVDRVGGAWTPIIDLHRSTWTQDVGGGAAVFYHEVGHCMASRADGQPLGLVDAVHRQEWSAFWQARRGAMPTAYAKTSASEGWAECCVEVLSGRVFNGYRALPAAVGGEVRSLLGL